MRGRRHDQSGNILVLFAILLPLFMVTGAIVIDVGYWWASGRKAQIAADACALAAASELPLGGLEEPAMPFPAGSTPTPDDDCMYGGRDYVDENLPGVLNAADMTRTKVYWPPQGSTDETKVEAIVRLDVPTFFGRFVGLDSIDLTRRAIAELSVGQGDYAIYAHSQDCGEGLRFNSLSQHIEGRVHSNGEFKVDGSGFWAAEGTHSSASGCSPDLDAGTTFGSPPTASDPVEAANPGWPTWWTSAQFGWNDNLDSLDTGCDFKGETIKFVEASGGRTRIEVGSPFGLQPSPGPYSVLPNYVYCASVKATLDDENMEATLTVLSPEIEITKPGQDLTAFEHGVLFFIVPNNSPWPDGSVPPPDGGVPSICQPLPPDAKLTTINNGPYQFEGVVFAPCTRVKIDAEHTTFTNGAILANEVEVNDKYFRMEGDSGIGATTTLALDT